MWCEFGFMFMWTLLRPSSGNLLKRRLATQARAWPYSPGVQLLAVSKLAAAKGGCPVPCLCSPFCQHLSDLGGLAEGMTSAR